MDEVWEDLYWIWKNATWWAKITLCPLITIMYIMLFLPMGLLCWVIQKAWKIGK